MNDYLQRDHTSLRVPRGPVRLSPSLALSWSLKGGVAAAGTPLVKGDLVVALCGARRDVVGLDTAGRVRWRMPSGGICAIVGDEVLISTERGSKASLLAAALATGEVKREDPREYGSVAVVVDGGRGLIERSWPEPDVSLRALRPGLPVVWTRSFGGKGEAAVDPRVACDSERCVLAVARPESGQTRMVALSLATGEDLWSLAIGEIDAPAREGQWDPVIVGELVVINTEKGLAAVRARDGHVAWKNSVAGARMVYGARAYVRRMNWDAPDHPSEIVALGVRDGGELWRRDYPEVLKKARGNRLQGYPVVSETHIFSGDDNGTVWAFDVNTGDPVWHHRAKGSEAFAPWTLPVIAGGRLYVASAGDRPQLFCYEQTERAAEPLGTEQLETEARVGFTIKTVHVRQRLTRSKPYFASGGPWTVLDCALQKKGSFFLAVKEGGAADEGGVWVGDASDGEALLKAIRKAFPARGVGDIGPGSRAKPPETFAVQVMGTDVNEGGGGSGTWTHSKCTGEDGAPEFYVKWSIAERRGAISEKDESYRKALTRFVAGLLVR